MAIVLSPVASATPTASTIKVNTTKDLAPTAGDCTGHNPCSLRQAVAKATQGDTVVVPAAAKHYVLTHGPIHVTTALTIRGASAKKTVIDGNGGSGVFVSTGTGSGTWTIEGVTITGAKATTSINANDYAPVASLGVGNLTLANCVITGNSASTSASKSTVAAGAVDAESGKLTITHCSITNNRVNDSSPLAVASGGVDSEGGTLTITASNISGNTNTMGGAQPLMAGGVLSDGGALKVTNSTVAANKATATNHTQPSLAGGGILSDGGPATLTNVTIADNKVRGQGTNNAGGLNNDGGAGTLVYVTLTRNSGHGAANLISGGGPFEPFGSIVALPQRGQPDCRISAGVFSQGYNFADDSSCGLNGPHDRTHGNPKLAQLASNGGPGPTEAPLSGSPLIDFIPKAQCAAGVTTDERGLPRPDDGEQACDIGAYEVQDK